MKKRYLRRAAGVWAALIVAVGMISSPGCSSTEQMICEEIASCGEGNEQDIEACVISAETNERFVSEIGCQEEYDLFYDCFLDKASCETSEGSTCQSDDECGGGECNSEGSCEYKSYGLEEDDCEAEQRAFNRCYDLD